MLCLLQKGTCMQSSTIYCFDSFFQGDEVLLSCNIRAISILLPTPDSFATCTCIPKIALYIFLCIRKCIVA